MKNLFKRFTAVIAAVLIFCISVFPSSVSALSSGGYIYSYTDSVSFDFMKSCYDSLFSNPSLSNLGSNYAVYIHFFNQYKVRVTILPDFTTLVYSPSSDETFTYYFPFDSSLNFIPFYADELSVDSLSTYNFKLRTTTSQYSFFAINKDYDTLISSGSTSCGFCAYSSNPNFDGSVPSSIFTYRSAFISSVPSFVGPPLPETDYSCLPLGIDIEGFVKYLNISQQKERIYKEYDSEVLDFIYSDHGLVYTPVITYYNAYGRSESPFFSHAQELYGITDFIKSDFDDVTLKNHLVWLHSVIKKLYSDYQKSKLMLLPDHEPNISTDDTLVTDVEDDTTDVSLLREIIRLLIKISNTLTNGFFDLVHKDFDISGDVDRIVTSINNIELKSPEGDVSSGSLGDVIVDVTITDEKQQELDDFFNGWSVDFDNKVKEKFPVTAQLGALFNDDFFEKCGIDCNGDGEVYSYYSENVYAVSETSTVSELSASSPGSDQKLVTDFLGQFDSADVNFLNDANFSSSVPDWSITVGGKKCEVFSFKLYAKYRTQIHFIMSFILWTVYLLSLYKSLPQIIGQVSDVVHGIEKM